MVWSNYSCQVSEQLGHCPTTPNPLDHRESNTCALLPRPSSSCVKYSHLLHVLYIMKKMNYSMMSDAGVIIIIVMSIELEEADPFLLIFFV